MRKALLIAALVLASASAQAAGPRSLSLASSNEPAAQPAASNTTAVAQSTDVAKPAETPAYAERPSAVSTPAPAAAATTASAPAATSQTATTTQPAAQTSTKTTAKASKPKHREYWTEGRIISELHRHGIYW